MLFNTQLLLSQKDQKNTLTYCFCNWLAFYWDGADGGFDRVERKLYLHFGVCSVLRVKGKKREEQPRVKIWKNLGLVSCIYTIS